MGSTKAFHVLAGKLGLGDNDRIISKAAEFERLLQNKMLAGSNITDTAKVVICIDLAASFLGVDLDLKTCIKYSGLKSPSYMSSKKMVENLLELKNDTLTVAGLCLTMQCEGAQGLAEQILKSYQANAKVVVDLSLPQYVCMAVYHACRLSKLKITKAKLVEKSRLRPGQWSKLDAEWTKFVDDNFSAMKKKKGSSKVTAEDENIIVEPMEVNKENNSTEVTHNYEPYDDWKKRILTAAYEELKQLKISNKMCDNNMDTSESRDKCESRYNGESKLSLKPRNIVDCTIQIPKLNLDVAKKESSINNSKSDYDSNGRHESRVVKCESNLNKCESYKVDSESSGESIKLVLGSPRRSPRKTPLKFTPYRNSPKKTQGVKLLFPL